MPLARHDAAITGVSKSEIKFLLTCLLRGMTKYARSYKNPYEFLLTCLLRGMTKLLFNYHSFDLVSTHMPLARHDIFRT